MTKSSLPQSVMPSVRLKFFFLDNISLLHLNRLRIMKTQQSVLNVVLIFAATVTALFVAGCAEVGVRKHNLPAYCGGIPRAHTSDPEATANLRCPATLPSRAGHRERTRFLRV